MNHSLFVSIDAQSYLDGQIFLKSVLFDFVTVTVEDRDLNKWKSTLSFPSSLIFLTFRISVSSPMISSSSSATFTSWLGRKFFRRLTKNSGLSLRTKSSFEDFSKAGSCLLVRTSFSKIELNSLSTTSPALFPDPWVVPVYFCSFSLYCSLRRSSRITSSFCCLAVNSVLI